MIMGIFLLIGLVIVVYGLRIIQRVEIHGDKLKIYYKKSETPVEITAPGIKNVSITWAKNWSKISILTKSATYAGCATREDARMTT
ncbi:MAG: hypothetical protein GXO25_03645 [Euryarchaeota archaeon]|nr:hypothetical protein [Euryarchaeota archaeon]